MKTRVFDCGCTFLLNEDDRVIYVPDINKIPLDCNRTWNLISSGNTKVVFQMESQLGQSLCSQIKPRSIKELSDICALARPGCLEGMLGDKTITQHYILRKNKTEPVTYLHDSLKDILGDTYGLLLYQEQSMKIAAKIAGFSLEEADMLRKAIGKKKPELMAKVKKEFILKAKEQGIVSDEHAEEIFGWIEKSQRYSFNKSHSVAYAHTAYLTAYGKAHFLKSCLTSYLFYAKDKNSKPYIEIKQLVNNARLSNVDVIKPDISSKRHYFKKVTINNEEKIRFGLVNIKGIGITEFKNTINTLNSLEKKLDRPVSEWSWCDFLIHASGKINKSCIEGMIEAGAMDLFNVSRTQMLHNYHSYLELSKRERLWVEENIKEDLSLKEILTRLLNAGKGKGAGIWDIRGVKKVQGLLASVINPGRPLIDNPEWISTTEEQRLGIALTCARVDACDTSASNCTCQEFAKGRKGYCLIGCEIEEVKTHKTKKGQEMAFLTVSDHSYRLDNVVCFSKEWKDYQNLLTEQNTVMICGEKGKEGNSFVIKKIMQL